MSTPTRSKRPAVSPEKPSTSPRACPTRGCWDECRRSGGRSLPLGRVPRRSGSLTRRWPEVLWAVRKGFALPAASNRESKRRISACFGSKSVENSGAEDLDLHWLQRHSEDFERSVASRAVDLLHGDGSRL